MQKPLILLVTILLLLIQGVSLSLYAQDPPGDPAAATKASPADEKAKEGPSAVTTADPTVPIDQLKLMLDPLTKGELMVEAEAWRDLLKANVTKISTLEIASRVKNQEIKVVKDKESEAEAAENEGAGKEGAGKEGAGKEGEVQEGEVQETKRQLEEEEEKKEKEKQETLDVLPKLREEKAALLGRFSVVLDSLEAKGGDASEYRQYAVAVDGIKVELTDINATWTAFKGWVVSTEGGVKWGLIALKFVAILIAFWILARIFGSIVRRATARQEKLSGLLKSFLNKIARRTVLFIGLLVALSSVGVNVGALLALIGGSAFIIGLALQDTLGNFAAGLMLLIYRPFDVGDAVEVGGVTGKVDSVSLVSTIIRTFDNKVILVPNKQVWGQVITNSTSSEKRRVDMVFGIGYGDNVEEAQKILERIIAENELVLKDPEPVVKLHELADSSVNIICRPWCSTDDYWAVYWETTRRVKEEFDAHNISIPYPQQDVHMHQVKS